MENSAIMSGTLNEPGIIGLLKPPEPRPDVKTVVDRESDRNGGVDIVELSGQSIQLTRAAAPNQTEQAAPAGIPQNDNNAQSNPESNTFNISTLRGILTSIEESGTTTSGTEAANAILNGDTTRTDTNPTRPPESLNGATPQDIGANRTTQGANASTLETTNTVTGGAASTVEAPSTERAQPTSSPETNRMERESRTEDMNTLEGEANELTKFNTVFNISNGLPSNTTNSMNTNDVVQAQQPAQYTQQMLLQNLSTQLAQTVPPAAVISVVG